MGYHVTILRTKAGKADPIAKAEVLAALGAMAGRLVLSGQKLELADPAKGDASALLIFEDGELWCSTPDEDFVALMIELADLLRARVRGDEYETYRAQGDIYFHPDDASAIAQMKEASARRRKSAWKLWGLRLALLAFAFGAILRVILQRM